MRKISLGAGVLLALVSFATAAEEPGKTPAPLPFSWDVPEQHLNLEILIRSLTPTDGYPGIDVLLHCKKSGTPVCIVSENDGGRIWKYERAAKEVLAGQKELVVINGPVYSAGVVFADKARKRVCITSRAAFYFHKAFVPVDETLPDGKVETRQTDLRDPPQSKDIDRWVRVTYHKYPVAEKAKDFAPMYFEAARKFWRVCELNPPLPRPRPHLLPVLGFNAHGLY